MLNSCTLLYFISKHACNILFSHFQACFLTRGPTVPKTIVLIMIIQKLPKISIGTLFIHTSGAAPGLSEVWCPAQNNLMVQPIFPPKKLGVATAMRKTLKVLKKLGLLIPKVSIRTGAWHPLNFDNGCQLPVLRETLGSKNPNFLKTFKILIIAFATPSFFGGKIG